MSLETEFPGLLQKITLARVAGMNDDEIRQEIFASIQKARDRGMHSLDIAAVLSGEPTRPTPQEQTPLSQALQFAEDVAKGAASGLTLGYVSPEVTPETSIPGRVAGELAGGFVPGLLGYGLTAPLRALKLTPALETILRSGATGVGLGAAAPAPDIRTRAEHALTGGLIGGAVGVPAGFAAELSAARAGAGHDIVSQQMRRVAFPQVSEDVTPQQISWPLSQVPRTPEAPPTAGVQPPPEPTFPPAGPGALGWPEAEPPTWGGEPAPLGPISPRLPGTESIRDLTTPVPPGTQLDMFGTTRPVGYPRPTPLQQVLSGETPPPSGLPATPGVEGIPSALTSVEVQVAEEMAAAGRIVPKAPFNVTAAMEADMTVSRTPGGKVTFTAEPPSLTPPTTLSGLRELGTTRGYTVEPTIGPTGMQIKMTGQGGDIKTFISLADAGRYLSEAPYISPDPISVPVEPSGVTVGEKVVENKLLTPVDKGRLRDQKGRFVKRAAAERYGLEPGEAEQATRPLSDLEAEFARLKAEEFNYVPGVSSEGGSVTLQNLAPITRGHELTLKAVEQADPGLTALFDRWLQADADLYHAKDQQTAIQALSRRVATRRILQDYVSRLDVPQKAHTRIVELIDDLNESLASAPDNRSEGIRGLPPGPAVEGGPAAGGLPAGTTAQPRVRFVGPLNVLGSPLESSSPVVRSVATEVWKAAMSARFRLAGWFNLRNANLVKNLGQEGGYLDAEAFAVVQGEKTSANPRVIAAVDFYNRMKNDFARRLGLDEWNEYATHVTDFDALMQTMRTELSKPYDQLDAAWKVKLNPADQAKYVKLLTDNARWRDIPQNNRIDIKRNIFEWDDVLTSWDLLPPGVRSKLPKEIFSPYMLPRVGGVPFRRSLITAFDRYVPVMEHKASFDPVMSAFRGTIEALPGANIPFSERWFLNNYIERIVLRKPSGVDNVISTLTNKVNEFLGKQLVQPDLLNQVVAAWRRGVYRGALGIDSAFINLTQSMNTWAEYGRLPIFKAIARRGDIPDVPGIMREFSYSVSGEGVSITGKLAKLDEALTRVILSPMRLTEFANRGLAFEAGLEEAMRMGYNFKDALVVGMGEASKVAPNLEMSAAHMEALKGVMKTQFGYTPETTSPFVQNPLARISTLFLSYPTRQLQFLSNGIADAIGSRSQGKLVRYLAATGFTFGAPLVLSQIGVDSSNIWGPKGFLPLSMPIIRLVGSAYNSVMGDSPYTVAQAKRDFTQAIATMTVPAWRYGKKVASVYQNLEQGYGTNRLGQRIYDTTPAGELMRLAGFGPATAYNAREQAKGLRNFAEEFRMDKQEAIGAYLQGDANAIIKFQGKWMQPITAGEIMNFQKEAMMSPQERALQGIRQQMRPQAQQQVGM